MAIIYQNEYGWLVDHRLAINKGYVSTVVECDQLHHGDYSILTQESSLSCQKFTFKETLFEIQHPIVMDSQFYALKMAQQTVSDLNNGEIISSNTQGKQRKRKKKRKSELNIGEMKASDCHNTVREFLLTAYNSLTDKTCIQDYFAIPSDLSDGNNNAEARMLARELDSDDLQEMCYRGSNVTEQREQNISTDDLESMGSRMVNHLITHPSKQARVVRIAGSQYILPPSCSFMLSDYTQLLTCQDLGKYDLIVLDPPWQNKSAKRKKSYHTLCNEDLLELPLPVLAADGCLVVIWVTNRWQHIQFIKELLFPHWSVQHVADWHWIKVTKSGQMVYDFDSNHKKPYEVIILGRYKLQQSTKNREYQHCSEARHSSQTSQAEALHGSSDSAVPVEDKVYKNEVLSEGNAEALRGSSDSVLPAEDKVYIKNEVLLEGSAEALHGSSDSAVPSEDKVYKNEVLSEGNAEALRGSSDSVLPAEDKVYIKNEVLLEGSAEALRGSSDSAVPAEDKVYKNEVLSEENAEKTGDECGCVGGTLPKHKVVVSIPSSLHSMKPPLAEILKPYTPSDPRCLELFARNLWPGWTSWGNQVLKHQHMKYFDPVT